jgi:hypothetical protein
MPEAKVVHSLFVNVLLSRSEQADLRTSAGMNIKAGQKWTVPSWPAVTRPAPFGLKSAV